MKTHSLKKHQIKLATLLVLYLLVGQTTASENTQKNTGFFDINLYPYQSDVDSDNTLTINIFSRLPYRLSYFSLTNFRSSEGEDSIDDIDRLYTEQNIRWQIDDESPIDLTAQMNFRTGSDNDRHRLGARWRLHDTPLLSGFFQRINLIYSINWHAVQFDNQQGKIWQLEHAFKFTPGPPFERIYLSGFVDHTFNEKLPDGFPDNPMVAETQLGYQLFGNTFLIAEYRLNQYRRSDVNNVAVGMQYIARW